MVYNPNWQIFETMENLIACLDKIVSTNDSSEIERYKLKIQTEIFPTITIFPNEFADTEHKKLLIDDIDDYLLNPDESNKEKIKTQSYFLSQM